MEHCQFQCTQCNKPIRLHSQLIYTLPKSILQTTPTSTPSSPQSPQKQKLYRRSRSPLFQSKEQSSPELRHRSHSPLSKLIQSKKEQKLQQQNSPICSSTLINSRSTMAISTNSNSSNNSNQTTHSIPSNSPLRSNTITTALIRKSIFRSSKQNEQEIIDAKDIISHRDR